MNSSVSHRAKCSKPEGRESHHQSSGESERTVDVPRTKCTEEERMHASRLHSVDHNGWLSSCAFRRYKTEQKGGEKQFHTNVNEYNTQLALS